MTARVLVLSYLGLASLFAGPGLAAQSATNLDLPKEVDCNTPASTPCLDITQSGRGPIAYWNSTNRRSVASGFRLSSESRFGSLVLAILENSNNPSPAIAGETEGSGAGLFGNCADDSGCRGVVGQGPIGVHGAGDIGVAGTTNDRNGWAGAFRAFQGDGLNIAVPAGAIGFQTNGTKNAVVLTAGGARSLYSEEASEVWFTDYGFGELRGERALVGIDPAFAETVNLDRPYHVFVQAYGKAELYVGARTASSFEVRLREGDRDVAFSYRIVAKRLGFEDKRLESAPSFETAQALPERGAFAALRSFGEEEPTKPRPELTE